MILYFIEINQSKPQKEELDAGNDETMKDVILRSDAYKAMKHRFYVTSSSASTTRWTKFGLKTSRVFDVCKKWTLMPVADEDERTSNWGLISPPSNKRVRTEVLETDEKINMQFQELKTFVVDTVARRDRLIKELNNEITGLEQVVRDLKRKK